MNELTVKVCVIGEFAVGKTSSIQRFVHNVFSEKYLTTIGVKIDTKSLEVDSIRLKMVIWDIAGSEAGRHNYQTYLSGCGGLIVVADGTRQETIGQCESLLADVQTSFGQLPYVLLVNKLDLEHEWEVSSEILQRLRETHQDVFSTSAKTGSAVESAFVRLGDKIVRDHLNQ